MFRKMRRFKQQLTDDACAEVLKNGQRGILAVLGDEGYPYTVPLDYVYTDGKLYFHSAAEGHKVDAVRAEPKASFCVLAQREQDADGWSYYFDSVVVFGKVQIIEDEEERLHALRTRRWSRTICAKTRRAPWCSACMPRISAASTCMRGEP